MLNHIQQLVRLPGEMGHMNAARRVERQRQLGFRFRTWGGARKGAGRPPNGARAGVSHLARPAFCHRHPLHVTLKVVPGLPALRATICFEAIRGALAAAREAAGFRLIHFSVQPDHLHLIVEAAERSALSRGMQRLCIRIARAVNRQLGRRGQLFADRYHARALASPRAVRFALRYVLLNVHKHARACQPAAPARGQHASRAVPPGFVDPCSSAAWFRHFARPGALVFGAARVRQEFALRHPSLEAPVASPKTWLLRIGWQRGAPFDVG